MPLNRLPLLSLVAVVCASATASAQEDPQMASLRQLGLQNITSISSHARMGGPQGISLHELPAARAYCESKQVDSFWAINAGSKAAVPQFDLAHPSHNPHAKGSRPFVSPGPLSRSPGKRRLNHTSPQPSYPYLSSTPVTTPTSEQPTPVTPAATAVTPSAVSTLASPADTPAPIMTTTDAAARFLTSLNE